MQNHPQGGDAVAGGEWLVESNNVEPIQSEKAVRLPHPVRITEQVWPEGTVPVVSVFCITYNHEKFIRDAIEGFLMQETTFPVQIFVHDDASTDRTAEIVKEYAVKYPRLFWTLLQTENQYSKAKFAFFFDHLAKQCGEFIALCEGDDYWTAPHKLQRQVGCLEKRQGVTICAHSIDIVDDAGSLKQKYPFNEIAEKVSLRDYLGSIYNPFHTASVVFRADCLRDMDFWWRDLSMGDWPLFMALLSKGTGCFMSDNMAVWRHHHGGVWALQPGLNSITKSLEAIAVMRSHLGSHYTVEFDKLEQFWRYREVLEYAAADNFPMAKDKLIELFGKGFLPEKRQLGVLLRIFLLGTFPKLHRLYRNSKSRHARATA